MIKGMKKILVVIIFLSFPVSAYCFTDRDIFYLLTEKANHIYSFPLHVYTNPVYNNPDNNPNYTEDHPPEQFIGVALPINTYGFFKSNYPEINDSQEPKLFALYQFSQGT